MYVITTTKNRTCIPTYPSGPGLCLSRKKRHTSPGMTMVTNRHEILSSCLAENLRDSVEAIGQHLMILVLEASLTIIRDRELRAFSGSGTESRRRRFRVCSN